jgi:aspartyl-tRNA(Asn)/glutamyl-tRNA(Gln) amidotransferase subunit C
MPEINEALIRKVADLARLELNDQEITDYVKSIGEILHHVDQLSEAKVDGVEPMLYGIDDALRLREDRVIEFGVDAEGKPKILACAPEVFEDGFKVPQIIGG